MGSAKVKRSVCTDPEWLGRADCRHCGIRHMMLFSGLQGSDFDHILEPIDNMRYPERAHFYESGESGLYLFSIRRGFVKLTLGQPDGSVRIVRLLGPGAIFGLEALLGDPYRHNAIALFEMDICRISVATLRHLESEKPWLGEKVMAHWENHLTVADRWISELSTGSVRTRTRRLLEYLSELDGEKCKTVRFFNYEDMAAMLGTTRESFTRTISDFKHEGLIRETDQRHVFSLDDPQCHV